MSRTGAPDWLAATLNYCSRCGASLSFGPVAGESRDRLACPECGFVAYVNPRIVVATIPVTATGEVVLILRAIEPAAGTWGLPGGFLEIDETAPEGAIRETLEETGLLVELGALVGVYSLPRAAAVVIVYEATISGGVPTPSPESLDVRAFAPHAIPWEEVVLEASSAALRDWTQARAQRVEASSGDGFGAPDPTGSVRS